MPRRRRSACKAAASGPARRWESAGSLRTICALVRIASARARSKVHQDGRLATLGSCVETVIAVGQVERVFGAVLEGDDRWAGFCGEPDVLLEHLLVAAAAAAGKAGGNEVAVDQGEVEANQGHAAPPEFYRMMSICSIANCVGLIMDF